MLPKTLLYEPSTWHACIESDWLTCDQAANCYSYILNKPEYHWSVPGLGYIKSKPQPYFDNYNSYFKDFSLEDFRKHIIAGAQDDGLLLVDSSEEKEGYYLTALFFSNDKNDFDFHWYRRDDSGLWSHKDGWRAVSNKGADGTIITDPLANHSPYYPFFGGYFLIPRFGITLSKDFPILN